ncbi:hypothetical protein D3C72_1925840 [compost metagenome]
MRRRDGVKAKLQGLSVLVHSRRHDSDALAFQVAQVAPGGVEDQVTDVRLVFGGESGIGDQRAWQCSIGAVQVDGNFACGNRGGHLRALSR